MKNKFRYKISCMILLIFVLTIAGCSQSVHSGQERTVKVEYNEDGDNKSIQSIAHVLKTEFTSPKQKYNEIIKNPNNLLKINGKRVLKASSGSELYQYIEGLYQSNFTNQGFEKFFLESAFSYTLQSKDIQIKVDKISIKKNKNNQKHYNFVLNVKYKKAGGPEKNYKIKGLATLPKEGKIADITYLDDSGLKEKIIKNS